MKRLLFVPLALLSASIALADFDLTIVHTNDLHGRVEPSKVGKQILGGYARHLAFINKVRSEEKNVILLNAGDTFQGTLYFTQYRGLADLLYLNLAKYDAATLGNHEFDLGPKATGEFAKRAQFPVLCSNMDFSGEPALSTLIKPSTIVTVGKEKVGVVGVMTPDLLTLSSPGPTIKMLDMLPAVQKAVDDLTAKGINKVILLSHMGYSEDKAAAEKLRNVDVIVGGHSHSLLGEVAVANRTPEGAYPTPVKGADGSTVLITQAWEWGKAVGKIKVTFDTNGKVKAHHDARAVLMDESMPEEAVLKAAIDALSQPILTLRNTIIAEAPNGLESGGKGSGESVLGNVICDAMLAKTATANTKIALMNSGGIRATLEPGKISFENAIQVQPFGNTLVVMDVTADELKACFENQKARFLQVSKGFEVTYDLSKPEGQQVVSMKLDGQPVTGTTRIVVNSFIAGGGDSYTSLKDAKGYRIDTGFVDLEALIDYLKASTPLSRSKEGRIKIVRS